MTLLFMDGMDLHGVTANLDRRYDAVDASVDYSTTSGRYGGGGITITDDDRYFEKAIDGTPQTCVASFAVKPIEGGTVADTIWRIDTSVANGGITFGASVGATIEVRRGTGIKLGGFVLPQGRWNWVSIKVRMDSSSSGTIDIEVNGVNVFSFTGQTRNSGTNTCNTLLLGATFNGDFVYDDVIITDIAGSAPFNDLLSDRRIDTIQPDAVGDNSDFTASPAVDNYLNVDESSPDDDTSYNESAVSSELDLYQFPNMGVSPGSIDVVNVVAMVKDSDAGGEDFELKVKGGTTDGTEGTGAAQTPTSGYLVYDEQFLTSPDSASAWTEAEVNAMQAGIAVV